MPGVSLEGMDHIVFTVRDIAETCAFYSEVLGMHVETYVYGHL